VKHKSIIVLRSERGTGKSSLVSNWVRQFSAENREVAVISHYIGSSGRSRDIVTFMRRCVMELREKYMPDGMAFFYFVPEYNVVPFGFIKKRTEAT